MSRILVIAALVALGWPTTVVSAAARVELRVYPRALDIGDAPRLVLVNNANVDVSFGEPYKLERWTRHRWRWINRRQAWPLPLLFLKPGETSRSQAVGVYLTGEPAVMRRGFYRVTKSVDLADGRNVVVRARFQVRDRPTGPAES